MSSQHKSQLRKTREKLHEANNLIKMYKARVAGDADSIVNYVQGTAAFGQYALEVLVAQHPGDRAVVIQQALISWAVMNNLIRRHKDGTLEVTHVCNKELVNGPTPTEQD